MTRREKKIEKLKARVAEIRAALARTPRHESGARWVLERELAEVNADLREEMGK